MKALRKLRVFALLLALAMLLAACGASGGSDNSTAADAGDGNSSSTGGWSDSAMPEAGGAAEGGTLKLGLAVPQTGTSAAGGEIALIQEGDSITIDIPNYSIHLNVSDEELEARRKAFVPPVRPAVSGWLARYARLVTSANTGAVLEK